ncbi:MAG: family 78 glycoside hydrolase catalytic domain [Phycisphaerales bacterium]
MKASLDNAKPQWIWENQKNHQVNQYVEFFRAFELMECGNAELRIAADSNFAAWLNGHFVGTGQFSDFPDKKTFTSINVSDFVRLGKNVLTILAYHCGQDHSSYISDEPGLWFVFQCGQAKVISDENTHCRISKSYTQGSIARISQQRGFCFSYDARFADNWTDINYEPQQEWQSSVIRNQKRVPQERPVPMLILEPRPPHEIIAQGVLKRFKFGNAAVAELMQHDFLSARHPRQLYEGAISVNGKILSRPVTIANALTDHEDGAYIIVDIGREECGFIDIELETSAGTVVDIAIGEHIADMRVRAAVGGRNFASRYITCKGRQHFIYYIERYAGRYIQLHFTNMGAPITLFYAGLIPANYPVQKLGTFSCSDTSSEKIYDVCGHTLKLCMHERYEDCPWREQALYGEDARTEALIGYYVFGEYNLARVSLDLLARSIEKDCFVQICAPTRLNIKIPFATMSWLIALSEYIRFSGDKIQINESIKLACEVLDRHCGQLIDDLLPCPQGKQYWHFYDWADGLSGSIARTDKEAMFGQRFDAILNFFFILALEEISNALDYYGQSNLANKFRTQAAAIRKASHKMFWNSEQQSYKTYSGEHVLQKHYAEMTQSLALLACVPDDNAASILRNRLTLNDNGWTPISLGMAIYKYDAILNGPVEIRNKAFKMISQQWLPMLYEGATTFWETIKGQADFDGAGSLCHGFSTIPAYVYQAHTLGITPLEPGFSSFRVRPVFGELAWASGRIPTPAGIIEISWEKRGQSYRGQVSHPASLKPVFADPGSNCEWDVQKND